MALLVATLGCFAEKNRKRLRTIRNLLSLEELRGLRMNGLKQGILKRSMTTEGDNLAKLDSDKAEMAQDKLQLNAVYARDDIQAAWLKNEHSRPRKLLTTDHNRLAPALSLRDSASSREAIHWNCGTFP